MSERTRDERTRMASDRPPGQGGREREERDRQQRRSWLPFKTYGEFSRTTDVSLRCLAFAASLARRSISS